MEPVKETQTKPSSRLVCYLRLTKEEHERLQSDSKKSGMKATVLLKKAYFGRSPVILLMTNEDRDHIHAQIQRIGNNVNQVTKKVNSGFAFGFQEELESIRTQLTILGTWLTAKYRRFKTD